MSTELPTLPEGWEWRWSDIDQQWMARPPMSRRLYVSGVRGEAWELPIRGERRRAWNAVRRRNKSAGGGPGD